MFTAIYFTSKDNDEATMIATHLIESRLVACANIFPIRSIYRWNGELVDTTEFACILKTDSSLFDKVCQAIAGLHSYKIPCILSFEIKEGNQSFLDWISHNIELYP